MSEKILNVDKKNLFFEGDEINTNLLEVIYLYVHKIFRCVDKLFYNVKTLAPSNILFLIT